MSRRVGSMSVLATLLVILLMASAPAALAHHGDNHRRSRGSIETTGGSDRDGDADSDAETSYNEDNDGDGKNNDEDTTASSHPSGKDRYVEPGTSGTQGRSESDPDDDGRGPERCEPGSSRTSAGGTCGPDKANGSGGSDIYDQDGNNGCGNDQDFDDDNEGWCGKPAQVSGQKDQKDQKGSVCDADANLPGVQKCDDDVRGELVEGPDDDEDSEEEGTEEGEAGEEEEDEVAPELVTNPASPAEDDVLGIRVTAQARPAVAPAAAGVVGAAGAGAALGAAGGVLPFTGSSDLLPLAAVALLLIGTGALTLRARRNAG